MILSITKEIIITLRQNNLDIQDFFILKGLKDFEIDILNEYDENNTCLLVILAYQKLFRLGYIELTVDDEIELYKLSSKGEELVKNLA